VVNLPTLTELHSFLLIAFGEAQLATDVEATTRCFLELIRRELYQEQLDVLLVIFRISE
jgi:DNA polymerase-3 subunit alpha